MSKETMSQPVLRLLFVTVKSLAIRAGFSSFVWVSFIGYWDKPATSVSGVAVERPR